MKAPGTTLRLVAALAVLAAGPAAAAAPSPQPAPGVYKHDFPNGDVQGDHFTSEDVLEVVPYQPGVDYVRLHLEFYNGHMCDIWGMARSTATGLLYQGPKTDKGAPCLLTLQRQADGVHIFEDQNGACREQTCGARGGYGFGSSPADFTPTERAKIRYMPRLLASREYKAAVAAFQGSPAT